MFDYKNIDKHPGRLDKSDFDYNTIDYVSGITMLSTGICLAGIRMFEPFFHFLIKKFIFNCFGVLCEEDEALKTQPLSNFLATSLNVELVHVILKGIKKFSNIKMD